MQIPDIEDILRKDRPPTLFEPSDAPFWDDPHISGRLLETHLDQDTDLASRTFKEIDGTVAWLSGLGLLRPGARILDLGCGPGLYAERMARIGCAVTGIDLSPRSIEFARDRAAKEKLPITYRVANFLDLADTDAFDVVIQAYGELSTFSDVARDHLLDRIHRALVQGGTLVFDVSTPHLRRRLGVRRDWAVEASGFWRPWPHIVLQAGYRYPGDIWCDQYLVVDQSGVDVYRMWFRDYLLETLQPAVERARFDVELVAGSLTGEPYAPDGDWIAVIARKQI
jgi:SAM-dependent methyltransferase